MIHRQLVRRVIGIAGAVACLSLAGTHLTVRADAGLDDVAAGAGASAPAVRLGKVTTTTPPPTTAPGSPVPASLTPLVCGTPLDNFDDARSGGRTHEGDDIVAPQNTPVLAVVNGTLYRQVKVGDSNASLSGNAWYLRDDVTGAAFFYAHLDHFADLAVGAQVRLGDVIAYVGDTGNPGPGNYHLHFEVHPKGDQTAAVNPQPYLSVSPCPT
jgi:murein DD-endopeptidase MepM/ murein hydrolase activator NlpD